MSSIHIKSSQPLSSDEATYIKNIFNEALCNKVIGGYTLEVKNNIHNFGIEFHKDASLVSISTLMNNIRNLTHITIDSKSIIILIA